MVNAHLHFLVYLLIVRLPEPSVFEFVAVSKHVGFNHLIDPVFSVWVAIIVDLFEGLEIFGLLAIYLDGLDVETTLLHG